MDRLATIKSANMQDADTLDEELSDWKIDSIQIGQGAFHLQSERIVFPDLVVERSRHNLAKKDTYFLPPNTTSISLFRRGVAPGHWCGYEVRENSLLVNRSGREHFAVLPEGYEHITISIDDRLMSDWDLLTSRFDEGKAISRDAIVPLSRTSGHQFRQWLFSCFAPAQQAYLSHDLNASTDFRELLQSGLARVVDEGLAMQGDRPRGSLRRQRYSLVRRACDLVHQNVEQTISTPSLAVELGVNPRSLQRGFGDVLGMTPHQYIQISKLRSVRRTLRDTPRSQTTVSAVAVRYGFTELGRFSTRYRRMFGELPSETLRGGARMIPANGESIQSSET